MPEIVWIALAALAGFVLGYGVRTFVSLLRRRRRRRELYFMPPGHSHRMEPLNDVEPCDDGARN